MAGVRIPCPYPVLVSLAVLFPSSAWSQVVTPDSPTPGQPGAAAGSSSPGDRQTQPIPGSNVPALPGPVNSTRSRGGSSTDNDLSLPKAEREGGGGDPTSAAASEDKAEETTPDDTKLLMQLLRAREDSPVKVFGWIENSFTGNANGRPKNGMNFGVNPNNLADQWMGNQYYLVIERLVRKDDSLNFGYRIDTLFGNDAQFNHAHGILDRAFRPNSFAQYDPAQYFAEVHLPLLTVGGIDIKAGRFYSPAGYEVVPATGRPLLSVPYMFNYGQPFTLSGMLTTLHLSKDINLYNGTVSGWDRQFDSKYTWSYVGGLSANSRSGKTSLATTFIYGPDQFPTFLPLSQNPSYPIGSIPPPPQFAGKTNPGYRSNGRGLFTTVLSYKWSDKLTQVMETDQAWETNVPFALGNTDGFNRHNAQWYSFGNWFLYNFNDKFTGVWRSEIFRDNNGVRTGTVADYCEFTVGGIYKPKPYIWIRPEIRYDFTNGPKVYNDDTRNSQLTIGFDVIFLF
jgi:Putative beta-barrel porin-2, OmpL-like. bbp2